MLCYVNTLHVKGKSIPLHEFEAPVFPANRHKGLGHLTPKKYYCYTFLLEAESTPEPQCGRKGYVNEKLQ
jgi:hypothetical protein